MNVEELREQLEQLQRSHDDLLKSISAPSGSYRNSTGPPGLQRAATRDDGRPDYSIPVLADTSTLSDDSDEEDESFFVQEALPSQSYDHEHLREHLKKHDWDEHGREILSGIFTDRARLKQPILFPVDPGPSSDRSHYSHFQVYDVGTDGLAVLVETSGKDNKMSKANEIWHAIKVRLLTHFPHSTEANDWRGTAE